MVYKGDGNKTKEDSKRGDLAKQVIQTDFLSGRCMNWILKSNKQRKERSFRQRGR
jgi:hypothetical protein